MEEIAWSECGKIALEHERRRSPGTIVEGSSEERTGLEATIGSLGSVAERSGAVGTGLEGGEPNRRLAIIYRNKSTRCFDYGGDN